jgi:phosphoribosyl 1,2-cyclic phosphodiesterase
MRFISLQSGSKGNCYYVESQGVKILFDAGISRAKTKEGLAKVGVDLSEIQAVILSHAHADHTKCAEILRKSISGSVWMTPETKLGLSYRKEILEEVDEAKFFAAGDTLHFGHLTIETIPTPHDAKGAVCFIVDDGNARLGILTDLGHPFDALHAVLPTLDGVLLESNYDPRMLEQTAGYPSELKRRIRSRHGHISNEEAMQLLLQGFRLQWACLGHISENSNTPEQIYQHYQKGANGYFLKNLTGKEIPVFIADALTVMIAPEL